MFTQELGKKIVLMLVLAGAIAGIVVVWLWAQKPEFQILFSNLSPEDASAVVDTLRKDGIAYSLSGDGTAVLVPAERLHDLRMQLASQGLPQGGGVGFEIFDRSTFGTTPYVQKLNYHRALQGELARTISQMSVVDNARVHLVIPERTLFSEQQEKPSASVVLGLRPGKVLGQGQIQGIVHLVASGVEGLSPQSITIVDSNGQILAKGGNDSSEVMMTNTQLEYQQNLEKTLAEKIQTMLERVVGSNKAVVRVSSLLDFRHIELTQETFDPETQVVRSEQRSQEKLSGSSNAAAPEGIPGAASNLPGAQQGQEGGASSENTSQKKNEVINYEISKTVSHIIKPFGTIKKLSVAAMVDGTYEIMEGANGESTSKYIPRNEEEMNKLIRLVKNAMGYSAERQDEVEVVNISFETRIPTGDEGAFAESGGGKLSQFLPIIRYGIGLALTAVAFLFVIRPVLKNLLAQPAIPTPLQAAVTGPTTLPTGVGSMPQELGVPEQIKQQAREHPQAVEMVVKKWIKET